MSKRLFLILVATLGLALSAQAPADAVESYPLTCLIGPANEVIVSFDGSDSAVRFHASNGPASSGLQPGQCAFNDRAVTWTQTVMCFKGRAVRQIFINGTTVDVGHSIFESSPRGMLMRQAMYGPTKLMNFRVHWGGNNRACLVIDKFGV